MVMQTAVGVTGEEAVDVGAATTRKAEEMVSLEVGFALVTANDPATQPASDGIEKLVAKSGF
jgi:hypothetical protein